MSECVCVHFVYFACLTCGDKISPVLWHSPELALSLQSSHITSGEPALQVCRCDQVRGCVPSQIQPPIPNKPIKKPKLIAGHKVDLFSVTALGRGTELSSDHPQVKV